MDGPPHDKHLTFSRYTLGCNAPGVSHNWLLPVHSHDSARLIFNVGDAFSSQKSVAERTNVKCVKFFCKWPLQSAELTISHLSPLSIDLSAAWLHSALLHAPFLIVSISCDSSFASSFSIKCDVKQWKALNIWSCSSAEHTSCLYWRLAHLTDQNLHCERGRFNGFASDKEGT